MIEMILSGFLFLFILVLNIVMGALGYLMEKDDYDPDAKKTTQKREAKKLRERGFKYECGQFNDGGMLFYKYK